MTGARNESDLDRRLRHLLLSGAPHSLSEEAQIQCAELCLSGGRVEVARALYEIVFLWRGFSAAELRWQAEVAGHTGLGIGEDVAGEAPDGGSQSNTVALAVDELERLARRAAWAARGVDDEAAPDVAPIEIGAAPVAGALDSVVDQVHALYEMMRRPWAEDSSHGATRMLQDLLHTIGRAPPVNFALICTAPVADLATAVVRDGLERWLVDCRDLIDQPFGSAVLLHGAARLETAGLGPYFRNVDQIIRRSADLLDLARCATVAAAQGLGMDIWVTLLSRKVSVSTGLDLVDELGDHGALSTMAMMVRWTASKPVNDNPIDRLWRLRDTALDLAAFDLAAETQAVIVRRRPHHLHELHILGAIQATGGHVIEAEAAFRQCLAANPNDTDAKLRLEALRAGQFSAFELRKGFGTSPRHHRAHRRIATGAAPDGASPTSLADGSRAN